MSDQEQKPSKAPRLIVALGVISFILVGLNMATSSKNPSDSSQATVGAPPPPYVCELPQAWNEGDPISEARKAALAEVARWSWSANPDTTKRSRCELNAKSNEQLDQDVIAAAKAATEKMARDKVEAAKAAAAEAKRQKEEAAQREKEARDKAEQERKQAVQEKRDAEQAARDHVKEIRDGIKDGSIKLLSATDLSAQTHKWDGQKIITTLNCFYADAGEYRCVGGRVRIDFSSFQPDSAEEVIKANCDTITKLQRRSCSLRILFTYNGFDEMDVGGGLFGGKMTVVKSQFGSGEILSK